MEEGGYEDTRGFGCRRAGGERLLDEGVDFREPDLMGAAECGL